MHGPVPAAPPHRPASHRTVVLLRVVFVALAVLSLGFLAWVTLLRAALVQRRPLGWWVFGADLALVFAAIALAGGHDENSWQSNAGAALILLQMTGAVVYYLVVDGRAQRVTADWPAHGARGTAPAYGYPGSAPGPAPAPGYGCPGADGAGYGYPGPDGAAYGYPGPPQVQAQAPAPAPMPPAPNPYTGTQQPPHQQPHPHPQPQRIDRVRAELDELSDYLRKEEGR
ncbi:hypothetical protein [Streptomyces sp. NPDC045470]|uniref:hypothetical protein n=1 Tax=unclassified Streptomyces TaxID=2593676 RepID=UPI0033D57F8E